MGLHETEEIVGWSVLDFPAPLVTIKFHHAAPLLTL
jgi:hypothetical protein